MPKVATASEIRDKVISFINRIQRTWNKAAEGTTQQIDFKKEYRIEKERDDLLKLHTDGTLYDLIYNTEEGRILAHEANEEFHGGRTQKQINDDYEASNYQTKLRNMLESYGWYLDDYGGGILGIVRDPTGHSMR